MRASLLCSGIAGVALGWATGCASRAMVPPPAAPTAATEPPALARNEARVGAVRELGPYLEASLSGRGGVQAFLFAASDGCRAALAEGSVVRVAPAQPLVRVTSAGGVKCTARGLASLAAWRDTLGDRRAAFLVVTNPASLRLVSEAHGYLLAVGRLPLAAELRWSKPLDLAAVLPDTPACRAQLAREHTEMEFRPRGEEVLVLRGRLDPCPVLAIAEPLLLQ
jgi:hypothetical protein